MLNNYSLDSQNWLNLHYFSLVSMYWGACNQWLKVQRHLPWYHQIYGICLPILPLLPSLTSLYSDDVPMVILSNNKLWRWLYMNHGYTIFNQCVCHDPNELMKQRSPDFSPACCMHSAHTIHLDSLRHFIVMKQPKIDHRTCNADSAS